MILLSIIKKNLIEINRLSKGALTSAYLSTIGPTASIASEIVKSYQEILIFLSIYVYLVPLCIQCFAKASTQAALRLKYLCFMMGY